SGSAFTVSGGAVYEGKKLVLAPKIIGADFAIAAGTEEIAPYAFSGCQFVNGGTLTVPSSVTKIGEGAFANSQLSGITLHSGITEIAPHTFAQTALTSFTVGESITKIGEGAFALCNNLETLSFAANSSLEAIGDGAFAGCGALKEINLPAGLKTLGTNAFLQCTALESAAIPSVETMGNGAFYGCTALNTVSFGANAKVTGAYTFANCSALNSVTLGENIKAIDEGAFAYCTSLETINLNKATSVGIGAFGYCDKLSTVINLDKLETIGVSAFRGCTSLNELNLTNAKVIENGAFANGAYTSVNIPNAEVIGSFAFFGGGESQVNLPASLKTLGEAAFANSKNLRSFTVDGANQIFFAEDGVLYRVLNTAGGSTYELCSYPTARSAIVSEDGVRTYSIKEGTVTVQAYAFENLNGGAIYKIVLPYSVKTIGAGAFYGCDIKEYRFESINAPALLSEYNELGGDSSHLFLYYSNFNDNFVNVIPGFVEKPVAPSANIYYPTNGIGYDNYIYSNYFAKKNLIGELIDDTTRAFIKAVKSFTIDTVKSWHALEV
ncbi:MAG: leucine-rich repeat domain-containing protein, partial [Clostridia bacterium]|nr:leucine-rich repeat domain-containing protein [Clostridia bacterium]